MLFCVLSVSFIIMVHETYCNSVGLYVSTSSKRKTFLETEIYLPGRTESFAIPHGQCSGFIDESLLCPYQEAGSVEVVVRDSAPYPDINIGNTLRNATVLRAHNEQGLCDDEADVEIYTSCVLYIDEHKRRTRSIKYLPPAPTTIRNH